MFESYNEFRGARFAWDFQFEVKALAGASRAMASKVFAMSWLPGPLLEALVRTMTVRSREGSNRMVAWTPQEPPFQSKYLFVCFNRANSAAWSRRTVKRPSCTASVNFARSSMFAAAAPAARAQAL